MADDISFLQEIDESLRAEKLHQFWQRFGNLVIASCVCVVLFTVASVLWKNHLREAYLRQTSSLLHAEAYLDAGNFKEAAKMFEEAEQGTKSLINLAKLKQAEALLDDGQKDKALALYDDVAESHGDEAICDLAKVQASVLRSNQGALKQPDIAMKQPFDSTLAELVALQLMKSGKTKEATEILTKLETSTNLVPTQRERIEEILDMQGSKQP